MDQLILHGVFDLLLGALGALAASTGTWAGRRGRPGLDITVTLQIRDGVIVGPLRALPERPASLSRLVESERALGLKRLRLHSLGVKRLLRWWRRHTIQECLPLLGGFISVADALDGMRLRARLGRVMVWDALVLHAGDNISSDMVLNTILAWVGFDPDDVVVPGRRHVWVRQRERELNPVDLVILGA